MRLNLFEHQREALASMSADEHDEGNIADFNLYSVIKPRTFLNKRNQIIPYYKIHCYDKRVDIEADYYVGLDWIIPGERSIYIAPKVNIKLSEKFLAESAKTDWETDTPEADNEASFDKERDYKELNYLKMFLDAASHQDVLHHTGGLLFIDWTAPEIEIEQKEDILTPFLIIQFLNSLKQIVRKGLKKSYYKVDANLQSKIKGKILVGQNIKTNIVKSRFTNTLCSYQEFGVNNIENRFLKKVLKFVSTYMANNDALFSDTGNAMRDIVSYCQPVFESISEKINDYELKHIKTNVFFREYSEAVKIGRLILKRFAYNISSVSKEKIMTPPFWIDMPRLFELYVYRQLLDVFNTSEIHYHYTAKGNELDFLITKEGYQMVVDAKYKLHYKTGQIHSDIRQVSGYARLEKVYKELKIDDNSIVDCMIIFPNLSGHDTLPEISTFTTEANRIKAYRNVYKLGIQLPV